jgi:predicted  nucleic acid-binding Zn-ribbon protein
MESQKKNNTSRTILIVLLLLSAIFNVYQWKNHSTTVVTYDNKIDSMITVRVDLERELATTNVELDKYRGISANLDTLLNEANHKMEVQEKKIRSLIAKEKDVNSLNKKLKSELEDLRKMKDEYLEKIDSLITENKELKAKNEELNTTVTNLNTEKKDLQSKVGVASQLKAEYVKISAFKKKNSGKYVEASLAKRTNKIDVCFTVMDNKVAQPGDKMLYVVIKEPTGKILAATSKATFKNEKGEDVEATASYKITYTGEKQNVCMNYETDERILTPGDYNVDVYIEGTLVANTQFMLK